MDIKKIITYVFYAFPILLIAFFAYLIVTNNMEADDLAKDKITSEQQLNNSQKKYDQINENYQYKKIAKENSSKKSEANSDVKKSNNDIQKNEANLNNKLSSFFNIYFGFSDKDDYNSRGQRLLKKGLITNDLAKDTKVFDQQTSISVQSSLLNGKTFFSNTDNFDNSKVYCLVTTRGQLSNLQSGQNTSVYEIGFTSGKISSVTNLMANE